MIFLPVFRNESFTFESFHVTEKLLSDWSFELLVFGVSIGSIFFFAENLGEKEAFFSGCNLSFSCGCLSVLYKYRPYILYVLK